MAGFVWAGSDLSIASLLPIMNDVKVIDPVLQVWGIKRLQSNNSTSNTEKYRLLLSDGVNAFSFAMILLPPNSERFDAYSFIKLKKYRTEVMNSGTKLQHRKVLLILEIEVVAKGNLIGNVIGEPVQLEKENSFIISQNHQLSAGSLWIIMDDQNVEGPIILQVLNAKILPHCCGSFNLPLTDGELYRIVLSDGANCTSWVLYKPPANFGGFETYSVIKLKKFTTSLVKCNLSTDDKKVIVILEAEVILDGSGAGNETIGNPKSIDYCNTNSNLPSDNNFVFSCC